MVDPAQATDAFIALAAGAATAGAATAGAAKTGAAAATAAAAAAAVDQSDLTVDSLLKQVQLLQSATMALPAIVLKDPSIKSAIASVQASAAYLQGVEVAVVKSVESIPAVKQLQGEVTMLAKALEPYLQPASLVKQLPQPLQIVEKEMEKIAMQIGEAIAIISRDGDQDLFNGYPFNAPALVFWFTSVVAYSSVAQLDDETPYRAGGYDPKAAERFYAKRWALKFGRTAQLIGILGGWGIGLLRDRYEYGGIGKPNNKWQENMPMRAKQILNICTRLGTAAIKIGQSLSIRGDILPGPYVKELSELQDRVKPFSTKVAKQIIEEELAASGILSCTSACASLRREINPPFVCCAVLPRYFFTCCFTCCFICCFTCCCI